MNISPFCNLAGRLGPNAWTKNVRNVYEAWAGDQDDSKLPYLPDKEASYRETYPSQNMKDNELLATRTKVASINAYCIPERFIFQIEEKYNPFERDIAVINIFYGTATAMGKKLGLSCAKLWTNLD